VKSLVCVACGAATVDQRALEQLVGQATDTPAPAPVTPSASPVVPARGVRPAPRHPTPLPTPSLDVSPDLTDEPVFDPAGLAAMSDLEFEEQLHHLKAQRRRQITILVGLGLLFLAFLVTVPLGIVGLGAIGWSFQLDDLPTQVALPSAPAPAPPSEPLPAPAPAAEDEEAADGDEPEAEAEPSPTEDDGSDEEADELDEPELAAEPEPAPAPQVDPVRASIDAGWQVASSDPALAAKRFEKALDLSPDHPEARYGLGYALLKLDRPPAAAVHLCAARRSSDAEIRRDVDALLANNGLTCSP